MDHSIMKLLEEDEDETMHSGADVEAFTAALNRDIEGNTSTSQPFGSDSALSQINNHTSSQLLSQWQTSSHSENSNSQSQQKLKDLQQQEQHSSEMELQQHGFDSDNQHQIDPSPELNGLPSQHKQSQDDCQLPQIEQNTVHISQAMGMQNSEKNLVHVQEPDSVHNLDNESQFLTSQKMSNQHAMSTGMSNQQTMSTGMSSPQAMSTGMSNLQAMTTGMTNQQTMATGQAINAMNRGKQVPFALLLPVITPQLDKDRAMQLQTLYQKLKENEISKEGFVRLMRSIVGDQMLKMAVYKLHSQGARNPQTGPNQFPLQSQASLQQQNLQIPSLGAKQYSESQSFTQLQQKGPSSTTDSSNVSSSAAQVTMDSNSQKSRGVEHQSDVHGMRVGQISSSMGAVNQERERPNFPVQGLSKPQQQQFTQASFPSYGSAGGNYHSYPATNVNTSATSLKQQSHDSQMRQVSLHQTMGATQLGTTRAMNMMSVPKFERQNCFSEPKRMQGGNLTHFTNDSTLPQNSVHWQSSTSKEPKSGALSSMTFVKQEPADQSNDQPHKSQLSALQGLSSFSPLQVEEGNAVPGTFKDESFDVQSSRMGFSTSTSMLPSSSVSSSMPIQMDPNISLSSRIPPVTSSVGPGSNAKTPLKKPSVGQKKPLEALGSSAPLPSKKQKVSGAFSDQSIEQLNDVTAVSGVNLREEEEQLFSGPKEDSRVSEASRRVVQEEEERLILQKIPLQKKVAEIMAKCGLKSLSNDVERCLSLCVEERMRGLISNLIRLSKQRVDFERPRHRTIITSDVRHQIMLMNRKAREEWEKKQAEAEKLQRLNEACTSCIHLEAKF
ncbi:unnamed protein product [Ilex paraguariensis]|uniref:RST domain-containing protein n=1 Tax=Ilex paraguariensis TaxID=185542 RepID=A0ABC8RM07_9AQUA